MSIEAMQWAFNQDIKPSSVKFVLVSLGDNAQHDGLAWPSIAALCAKTGQDRKTVISALNRLEEGGFLSDSGKRTGGTGQIKVYRFNFDRNNSTENGTVPKTEQYRNSRQRVPKNTDNSAVFPSNSTENGTRNPQEPKEPKGNPQEALAPSAPTPIWKPLESLVAAGVDKKTASDWLTLRKAKKAPVTETVLDMAMAEAVKAKITLPEALKICCSRGWAGFKAEWIIKDEQGKAQGAWYATEASVAAKAAELGLRALAGESPYTFKSRIQAALDNGGKPPVSVSGRKTTLPDVKPEPETVAPSPENRAAALGAARALRSKATA